MNNQFSIAQRVGLMFRYDQELPQDMETVDKGSIERTISGSGDC